MPATNSRRYLYALPLGRYIPQEPRFKAMTPLLITCPKRPVSFSCDSTYMEASAPTFKSPEWSKQHCQPREACLVHIYPATVDMGRRYSLGEDPVLIGRGEECAIHNPDGSVSRCHARIVRGHDGQYSVTDLGSTNGTFINNSSRRESFLCDGDYLRVGNCIYRFLAGGNIEADYHEEIYRLTIQDALTETHNRRYFIEFLEREVGRSMRHNRSLAVILIDIDHFKDINDKMGHLVGDMALRELCQRVRSVIRDDELLARYGGEEFAIVLPEADSDSARATAERIRLLVEKQPFSFNRQKYALTISAGVAMVSSGEAPSVDALLAQADENLYRAKQAGRNRVVVS
jgi:two-component system cell cycle response regulator